MTVKQGYSPDFYKKAADMLAEPTSKGVYSQRLNYFVAKMNPEKNKEFIKGSNLLVSELYSKINPDNVKQGQEALSPEASYQTVNAIVKLLPLMQEDQNPEDHFETSKTVGAKVMQQFCESVKGQDSITASVARRALEDKVFSQFIPEKLKV